MAEGFLQKLSNFRLGSRLKRRISRASGITWQLKKLRPNVSTELQCVRLLKTYGIESVIDVGANVGQFAEGILDYGFEGRIFSFEPVELAHSILSRRASRRGNWTVHERCSIGARHETRKIQVSSATVFSSLLSIGKEHVKSKPASRVISCEETTVFPLDDIWASLAIDPKTTLLKVDTQGFEKPVIDGASELIASGLKGIKLELPLVPIYEGIEWSFDQILEYMRDHGFSLTALQTESVDEATGQTTTLDGTFFRRAL